MSEIMEILFWISGIAILYTYVGYPLLLSYWPESVLVKEEHFNQPEYEPAISIIIPVYNEEGIIREKIENTLFLDYPKEKKEILNRLETVEQRGRYKEKT